MSCRRSTRRASRRTCRSCAPCAAAYAEFRATIEALRELPKARMPHVVHLPSTPPVAERSPRPRIGLSWFNLGVLRRFPATAVAGAIAVVLVIVALTHPGGGTREQRVRSPRCALPAAGSARGARRHTRSRVHAIDRPHHRSGAAASFTQEALATDPAQPALHLVLAAPTLVVNGGTPGGGVRAALGAGHRRSRIPGVRSHAAGPRRASVRVGRGREHAASGSLRSRPASRRSSSPGAPSGATPNPVQGYPARRRAGTAAHLPGPDRPRPGHRDSASSPPSRPATPAPGSPPLTAELTLTTR